MSSTQFSIHSFAGGMVTDKDVSLKNENTYDYAENLRFMAQDNSNTGTLHSVEDSSVLDSGNLDASGEIVGHCRIRDYLVVFISTYSATPSPIRNDKIVRYDISDTGLSNYTLLYSTTDLFQETPSSTTPEMLSVVGRYEDSDNIKVYWANSEFPIRTANIAKYVTDDGLVTGSYLSHERLNLITEIVPTSIDVSNIIDGSLISGKYDYAYSLVKKNGQESKIIYGLSTGLIPLFEDSLNDSNTVNIKGDLIEVNTGKGVELSLDIDTDDATFFDKIRLYRIHYKDYGELPDIVIVKDINISPSGGVHLITDIGNSSLGTYTVEEFIILSNIQYTAYTILEKDNYLVAGNVKENVFDVSFDARAFRFNTAQISRLYDDYYEDYTTTEYAIDATGTPNWPSTTDDYNMICPTNDIRTDMAYQGTVTTGGVGTSFTDSGASGIWVSNQYLGWRIYNITAGFNDIIVSNTSAGVLTTASSHTWTVSDIYQIRSDYLYQSNGTTLGGEGLNVKYEFDYITNIVDIDDNNATYTNANTYSGEQNTTYINTDYSSPLTTSIFGYYQRDEVYRFGIVFFDSYGNTTPVKWMADIRFPGPYSNSNNARTIVTASDVYPVRLLVTLKSGGQYTGYLPTNAVGWQVVRAKRNESDKTVIAAGYGSATEDHSGLSITGKYEIPVFNDTVLSHTFNYDLISFVDPQSVFNNFTNVKSGDYIDLVGTLSNYVTDTGSGEAYPDSISNTYNSIKYRTLQLFSNTSLYYRYSVDKTDFIKSSQQGYHLGYTGAPSNTVTSHTFGVTGVMQSGRYTLIQSDSTIVNTLYSNYTIPYIYIKRNNLNRYGGYTHEDRKTTEYISTSAITTGNTISTSRGDTYINYFDYLNCISRDKLYDPSFSGGGGVTLEADTTTGIVMFPVESKINLNLRSDNHYAKVYTESNAYMLTEEAGLQSYFGKEYQQDTNLYLYNSIYSQEGDILVYSFSDNITDFRTNFDSRFVHSDKKFNDEYIDSWTQFRPNNFLDVESKHGPITSLIKFNNNLYFTQEDAFGLLAVNQRSLISDNNPGTLALGTGGILSRFDYISESYGAYNKKAITVCNRGIYFFDSHNRAILAYNGQFDVLSNRKGIRSYLNGLTLTNVPILSANNKNEETYFKLSTDGILVYENDNDAIRGIQTYNSQYLGDTEKFHFHKFNSNASLFGLYLGTTGYGSFNGRSTINDSLLRITTNDSFPYTKVYDSIIFFSNNKLTTGIEHQTDTFDTIALWNDYQYTGEVSLVLGDNLRRRERGYTFSIPRNIVDNDNGTVNLDIFNSGNHYLSSQTFKERLRDKYLVAELKYDNAQGQLSVPYIQFLYRFSKR